MRTLDDAKIDKNWKSFLSYRSSKLHGIQTGITPLDRYLLGLGGVTVLQGGTGCNKSTLALQIAHCNLKLGHPCIMLDKENGEGRIRMRLLCQANGVTEADLKVCSVEQLKKYREPVLSYPLHIYTEPVREPELIEERLKEAAALYGSEKPMLLIVDSLQAMNPIDDDQRVSLEKWMYFFDSLKLMFDGKLTIIVTSEKNRASYQQTGIGGGKGSNAIDYKAETLLDMNLNQNGLITLDVAKNRDGASGARFQLEKRMADSTNPTSFTFMLDALGDIDV